jgi:ABC-type uncharacterized transport system ATPase subunit
MGKHTIEFTDKELDMIWEGLALWEMYDVNVDDKTLEDIRSKIEEAWKIKEGEG